MSDEAKAADPTADFIETDLGPLGKVKHRRDRQVAPLSDEERSVLTGFVAARDAVIGQMEGYLTNVVCARLGTHRNRLVNADIGTGVITLTAEKPA